MRFLVKTLRAVFSQKPLHLALLPLCFSAYALNIYFGRARVGDALALALMVFAGMLLLWGILRLFLRKPLTASLLTTILATVYLYWNYPYLRLKAIGGESRWTSLPALLFYVLLLAVLAGVLLSKTKDETRRKWNHFFNLLFGVLFLFNSAQYARSLSSARRILSGKTLVLKGHVSAPVFVLLFDELGSLEALQGNGVSTESTDSFLRKKGFFIPSHSRSNYPATHFSIASALNETYLSYPNGSTIYFPYYNAAQVCIRNNVFVESFVQSGAVFKNRSVFSIAGQPPFGSYLPLVEGRSALPAGTLGAKLLWPLMEKRFFPGMLRETWFAGLGRNKELITALKEDAQDTRPQLVYAHFYLPHQPFYFAPNGTRLSYDTSVTWSMENNIEGYRGNARRALEYVAEAVSAIQQSAPHAIILLIGDHGYRNEKLPGNDTAQFQNFCAVYYPDKTYAGWHEDITLVNVFRLVHSKVLGVSLPFLPDKTVLLKDATGLAL